MRQRIMIFFFQAEDGIRDTSVTGVQTCALPIWHGAARACRQRGDGVVEDEHRPRDDSMLAEVLGEERSEERRIGKECRSRWSQDHSKRKTRKSGWRTICSRQSQHENLRNERTSR